jgi:hypothetical protein
MNQNECNELRDLLFAEHFPDKPQERLFRYLGVLPGDEGVDAVVHFAYASPAWTRAGFTMEPTSMLKYLIAKTPFNGKRISIKKHDYQHGGWTIPWGLTAKESSENFPTLVLVERGDGTVTGAVVRDPHTACFDYALADLYVEPAEIAELLESLASLETDEKWLSVYKESDVAAPSLQAALEASPETEHGQKMVLLYRGDEWLSTIWNNPETSRHPTQELKFLSLSDFYGTRASISKARRRSDLTAARACQTLTGDYAVLKSALEQAHIPTETDEYEQHPAVRALCSWWNTYAPEEMRYAGCFRVYHWDAENCIFTAGDPEEPALQADSLSECPSYALFENEGELSVAVQFFRGRTFNTEHPNGTQTYFANGETAWMIGTDPKDTDEAYYSIKGLRTVKRACWEAVRNAAMPEWAAQDGDYDDC